MYTHSSHLLMMMIGMGHFNMMKNVMAHHVGVSPSIYLMHCLYNRIKFTCRHSCDHVCYPTHVQFGTIPLIHAVD